MAAQDAELKLKVSLDLAFFRQQLSGLGQAAAGYNVPINVKFDRRSVQNELNALGRNISQRTYRLEVATNISQEIKNAGTLAKALRGLDNAIQKNRGIANRAASGSSASAVGTVNAASIEALIKKSTKPALEALYGEMSKAKIPMADVGKGTVDELRKSIISGVPAITQDIAKGLANGLNPELKENGTKGARFFIDAFKTAAGIASPSKVFKALGEFSADGLEIGFLNGLQGFKTKAIAEIRQIVALMKLELASVGDVNLRPGTGAARAGVRGGSQYMSPIGPLPEGSVEPWAWNKQGYRYDPYMAQPGQVRGAGVRQMQSRYPFAPAPSIMGTTSSPGMLGRARLALPAAGETSAVAMREAAFALREITARQRSEVRSASVMGENRMWSRVSGQVPVGAGGPFLPPGGGGGNPPPRPPSGGGGISGFGRTLGSINLPGTGVVREIGNEFAMATKQVLLFGTAYKALAFATSFPGQVGQAVAALQSFRNTLNAISPTAKDAAASNQLIIDTVNKYNIPIQSARSGFTKLYASMKPAGFSGDQIGKLFVGISKASATLGLSSEKVDRVTYAFSQMASKGQLMSEEVSGQLGDVIPGALSIMAEAANMDIKTFKKAMEDGVFVGKEFEAVMSNVPIVLEKRFGKGAEGAAKTFQGALNNMQTSLTLLYEAFEPVAVGFLNSVVTPLTSGIKTVTDGFNAFFTGTQAKTAGGMAFAKELEALRPTFEGIQANLAALIPSFQLFGGVLLNVAKFLATVAGNPITGFLLKVYTNVLLVNTVFTLLGGRILVGLIANIGLATSRFIAMNAAVFALQRTSAVTNSTLAGTQLQMLLLQKNATGAIGPVNALLGSLLRLAGIGIIAIAVTIAINGANELRDAELRLARLRGERDPVGPDGPRPVMTPSRRFTGASRETVQKAREAQAPLLLQYRKELQVLQKQLLTAKAIAAASEDNAQASLANTKLRAIQARVDAKQLDIQNAQGILNLNPSQYKTQEEQQRAAAGAMATGGVVGGGGTKPKKERESQLPMLRLELEKAKELFAIDQQLIGARLADNASLVSSLELQKQLTELKYQGKQIALEQIPLNEKQAKMAALAVEYEKAIMESQLNLQLDMQKAREDLQRSVEDTVKGYELENEYQQRYYELVQQGISPALAKIRVEIEKTFRKEKERVDTLIEQYELQKASLKVQLDALLAQDNLSDIDSKRLADIKERIKLLDLELEKMGLLKGSLPGAQEGVITAAEGAAQPAPASVRLQELADESKLALEKLLDPVEQIKTISETVSESIGSAFKGLITGATTAQEALANVFQSIADSFADMVAQIITEWLRAQLIKGLGQILNLFVPGAGAITGAIGGGLSSGFSAGASSAIDTSAAGWGAAFNTNLQFANGGIASGGFRAFANGGIVSGPTLGLVGEGRYNEAVIPLPDGKSVPVDLGGAMGGQAVNNIVVNVDAKGSKVEGNDQEGKQLGRVVAAAVQQELIKQKRPGGLLF
jgi:tape measure domain-containing protein